MVAPKSSWKMISRWKLYVALNFATVTVLVKKKTWKKTDDGQTIIFKLNAADVFLSHLGQWSNEIVL